MLTSSHHDVGGRSVCVVRFCGGCPATSAAPPPSGAVTLLFTDVQASTRQWEPVEFSPTTRPSDGHASCKAVCAHRDGLLIASSYSAESPDIPGRFTGNRCQGPVCENPATKRHTVREWA